MRFLLRRLGFYAIAAFFALLVNFALPRMMPGDAASAMFAQAQGKMEPEALDALRAAFGATDAPLHTQFVSYVGALLQGDLGTSVQKGAPVIDIIASGLPWTLLVAGLAMLIAFTLGTCLGVIVAWRRTGWLDSTLPPTLAFLGAFPYFWLALLLLYILGFSQDLLPIRHAYSDTLTPAWSWAFIADVAWHAVLPVGSIVIATLGGWLLSMRNTMIGVLSSDYIRLAHARGLSPRRIMWAYAARNALLPNVTGFGMAMGFVVGGALLTEIVFSYPGQGLLLLEAVRNQDYPLMQGIFLVITLAVLCANWLVDIAYVWLDPRTRT